MKKATSESKRQTAIDKKTERERAIFETMQTLRKLDETQLLTCHRQYEDLIFKSATMAYNIDIELPINPSYLIGTQMFEDVVKNLAEWIMYLCDINVLIEEKRNEGKQLQLPLRR